RRTLKLDWMAWALVSPENVNLVILLCCTSLLKQVPHPPRAASRSVPRYHFKILMLVRRYHLQWIAVSYSRPAVGTYADTVLMVAGGAPPTAWRPHSLIPRAKKLSSG